MGNLAEGRGREGGLIEIITIIDNAVITIITHSVKYYLNVFLLGIFLELFSSFFVLISNRFVSLRHRSYWSRFET